jgi:hypothetical protein
MDFKQAFFKAENGKISVDLRVEVDECHGDELLEIISKHFNKEQNIVSISKVWFSSSDVQSTIKKDLEQFKDNITRAIDDSFNKAYNLKQ